MRTTSEALLLLTACAVLLIAAQGVADVVVYRTGNFLECTLSNVDNKHVTIKTEYGDQKISRGQLLGWYQSELGKPGSDFFRAGQMLAERGMKDRARPLFEKAVQLDPSYNEPAMRAMAGGTTGTTGGTTISRGPTGTTVGEVPGKVERLLCPVCGGEGQRALKKETPAGTTLDYVVPCYFCDGKGLKFTKVPHGCRICPSCSGWGYTPGAAGSGDRNRNRNTRSTSGRSNRNTERMASSGPAFEQRQACFQ